jgi:hypothetical protein
MDSDCSDGARQRDDDEDHIEAQQSETLHDSLGDLE